MLLWDSIFDIFSSKLFTPLSKFVERVRVSVSFFHRLRTEFGTVRTEVMGQRSSEMRSRGKGKGLGTCGIVLW